LCFTLANVHSFTALLILPGVLLLFPGILIAGLLSQIAGLLSQNWVATLVVVVANAIVWCLVRVIQHKIAARQMPSRE
jgi:hypothetical protein